MDRIDALAWASIRQQLDDEGHAEIPRLLDSEAATQAGELFGGSRGKSDSEGPTLDAALPSPFADWRSALYRHLAPLANQWHQRLAGRTSAEPDPLRPGQALSPPFPPDLVSFLDLNREAGQRREQPWLTRLTAGEEIRLHPHPTDDWLFPFRVVILLSAPGRDFDGGELVLVEQRPRMQSRPMVLSLLQGDAAILCASTRPVRGSRGDYAVRIRHGVSRLHAGQRLAVDLAFHLTANR